MKNKRNNLKVKEYNWIECACGNDEFQSTRVKSALHLYCPVCNSEYNISIRYAKSIKQ